MNTRCPECDIEVNDEFICPLCGENAIQAREIAPSVDLQAVFDRLNPDLSFFKEKDFMLVQTSDLRIMRDEVVRLVLDNKSLRQNQKGTT